MRVHFASCLMSLFIHIRPSENSCAFFFCSSSKLLSGTAYDDGRSKKLFKRQKFIPVYDLVPCMRPVILVGPSLKGFEVIDIK